MANRGWREALRGAEEQTFDLLAQVLASDQWAELLKAPLGHAARQGNRVLAQKLVRAGAEIGDALHEATRGGHGDVVSDLLENGAPVDAKDASRHGNTPLHVAAIKGETEMVQLLLVKGADKDALDNDDYTPLYVATLYDNVAAALALMAAGADVTLPCGPHKKSVAHLAAGGGHVDVLRAAIERGADVDAIGRGQLTPLHDAAISNRVGAINVLLEAGAIVDVRDGDGRTPLHYAANRPSYEAVTNLEAVLTLLKHGADVNAQDNYQETPLHWAAGNAGSGGAVEVVDSLLRSGADETIPNVDGEAPADVVARYAEGEEDGVAEDIDRVRELLANAPVDRAWRRRGYLVLCRAHSDRVRRQIQDISSSPANTARRTRSGAGIGRAEAGGSGRAIEASPVDGRDDDAWIGVVARVLGLQEEGIFRTIVGYL